MYSPTEMVYVPTGSFSLGSGGAGTSEFYQYPTTPGTYTVSSENAITVGASAGNLYYASSTYGGDQSGPIPGSFPKGFAAFYCMKYDITQEQYVDFEYAYLHTTDHTDGSLTRFGGRDEGDDHRDYLSQRDRGTVSWQRGDISSIRLRFNG